MGLKVRFVTKKGVNHEAYWTIDGTELVVYNKKANSKTDNILSLIHEIGHHVWFIHEKNRKKDERLEKALDRQDEFEENTNENPAPKKLREKILNMERASTDYWYTIYKDTNLKFPLWKLYAQMEFDVWQYEVYYDTGHFPRFMERRAKWKDIARKHKNKQYE